MRWTVNINLVCCLLLFVCMAECFTASAQDRIQPSSFQALSLQTSSLQTSSVPSSMAAAEMRDPQVARTLGETMLLGDLYDDRNGNHRRDHSEPGIADVAVSNGRDVVRSDRDGHYRLAVQSGQTVFVIKPADWEFGVAQFPVPAFWVQIPSLSPPTLKYGGIASSQMPRRFDIGLRRTPLRKRALDVLVFGDPQVKSQANVGYYGRDIIDTILHDASRDRSSEHPEVAAADLGLSLGDIADDTLSLYPALNAETRRLQTPWLHAPGNHDIDSDAQRDEDALLSFRNVFGPDTFAWEEREATFVVLDDVIYRQGQKPAYIGGFREDQFTFLEAYLPSLPKDRLLVLSMHIPLFEPEGKDTFRDADRARLFALLKSFPHLLVLSAHNHTQQHYLHDARTGWQGAVPLHEYNVGAACGAYWSGAKDARGIPDATMADGTPNGYARLRIDHDGRYALAWRVAGEDENRQMGLHAPKVLRRGAYPAWGVFANVYMGRDDTRVEYRIDDGAWLPMTRVLRPDPQLLVENMRDDLAERLRGYDRSPEAEVSLHLWRGALPTDLALGAHRIEVRAFDAWQGEVYALGEYRLLSPDN